MINELELKQLAKELGISEKEAEEIINALREYGLNLPICS